MVGDDTVAALRGDDLIAEVFERFPQVPVTPMPDDPRVKAAEAEARRRLPEFVAAFRSGEGTDFGVNTRIVGPSRGEHIWVDAIESGRIRGRLANDPVDLGDLKLGSPVEFDASSRRPLVCTRLTGISLRFLSSIRGM